MEQYICSHFLLYMMRDGFQGKRIIPTIDIDEKIYVNPGISKLSKIIKQ